MRLFRPLPLLEGCRLGSSSLAQRLTRSTLHRSSTSKANTNNNYKPQAPRPRPVPQQSQPDLTASPFELLLRFASCCTSRNLLFSHSLSVSRERKSVEARAQRQFYTSKQRSKRKS